MVYFCVIVNLNEKSFKIKCFKAVLTLTDDNSYRIKKNGFKRFIFSFSSFLEYKYVMNILFSYSHID